MQGKIWRIFLRIFWSLSAVVLLVMLVAAGMGLASKIRNRERAATSTLSQTVNTIVVRALPDTNRVAYGAMLKSHILAGFSPEEIAQDKIVDWDVWIKTHRRADVFMRKIVYPRSLNQELFACAVNAKEEQYVAWVDSEITHADATKRLPQEFTLQESDRCFAFSTPNYAWDAMCGQAGVLVLRDKKIAHISVTVVN